MHTFMPRIYEYEVSHDLLVLVSVTHNAGSTFTCTVAFLRLRLSQRVVR